MTLEDLDNLGSSFDMIGLSHFKEGNKWMWLVTWKNPGETKWQMKSGPHIKELLEEIAAAG
jgi:hypothetical protein